MKNCEVAQTKDKRVQTAGYPSYCSSAEFMATAAAVGLNVRVRLTSCKILGKVKVPSLYSSHFLIYDMVVFYDMIFLNRNP